MRARRRMSGFGCVERGRAVPGDSLRAFNTEQRGEPEPVRAVLKRPRLGASNVVGSRGPRCPVSPSWKKARPGAVAARRRPDCQGASRRCLAEYFLPARARIAEAKCRELARCCEPHRPNSRPSGRSTSDSGERNPRLLAGGLWGGDVEEIALKSSRIFPIRARFPYLAVFWPCGVLAQRLLWNVMFEKSVTNRLTLSPELVTVGYSLKRTRIAI